MTTLRKGEVILVPFDFTNYYRRKLSNDGN